MKVRTKFAIYILSVLTELLLFIIAFIFSIWTKKFIKILSYINLILVLISAIYPLILICIFLISKRILVNSKLMNYYFKFFNLSNVILNFAIFCSCQLLNPYNNYLLHSYSINCPFTLISDLYSNNSSYIGEKRCELYNIYNNSRYKYQYICSYNPYDDLKNEKTKDGLQKIQCVQKVKDLKEFEIIDKFTQIYQEMNISQLFYCNLVEMPMKNDFIPEKYCNYKESFILKLNIPIFLSYLIVLLFSDLYKDLA